MLHAVIMAGGSGTRFWPASRQGCPKQLLALAGGKTMIQATVARLGGAVPPERVMVVTNERLAAAIAEQLPSLPEGAVLGEPCKRDTAPCIGLAAIQLARLDPDATMIVMPADHEIGPDEAFQRAIGYAAVLVEDRPERIITFGVRPTYASASFGYIERGGPLEAGGQSASADGLPTFQVARFREKPSQEVAKEYLESGNFYWNSGIFVWKAEMIMQALSRYEPEMYAHLEKIAAVVDTPDYDAVLKKEFTAIKGKSIDYAVMERASDVVVVEAPFDWDDVGNWQALARLRGTDESGNTIDAKHLGVDTTGTIVRGDEGHLIVTVGLKDCIVVHTPDATLVADKHAEEALRQVVKRLEEKGWTDFL